MRREIDCAHDAGVSCPILSDVTAFVVAAENQSISEHGGAVYRIIVTVTNECDYLETPNGNRGFVQESLRIQSGVPGQNKG